MIANMIKLKIFYSLSLLAGAFVTGLVCAETLPDSRIYALTSNGQWILELAYANGKLEEKKNIKYFERKGDGLIISMGSRLNVAGDRSIIFSGKLVNDFLFKNVIAKYDINKDSLQVLGDGLEPLFNRKFETVLFRDSLNDSAQSIPTGIYIAKLKGENLVDKKLLMPYVAAPAKSPIMLEQEGFALYDAATKKTVLISPDASQIKILDLTGGCIPLLYRSKTQELVCITADNSKRFYLLDPRTNITTHLGDFSGGPGVYLRDTDSMIYSRLERQRGKLEETINYYIYSFETGKSHKIKKDLWVDSGSMVLAE